jgi:exodeoxyribonuclease I
VGQHMSFVFYDTETTGVETSFDQVLQFAAIHTDDDLVELDSINLRCKRLPHIVPAPGALLVTGISPEILEGENRSHYQMFREVEQWLKEKSPSIFVGYNSIRFDEVLLRQAFYKTLQPLYLTNTNGNCRGDLMSMAQAVATYAPQSIKVNDDGKGRYVFKLGDLVRANGINFSEEEAHDALADVRATIELAKLLGKAAPDVWTIMLQNAQKKSVVNFVDENAVFCLTNFYFGKPFTNVVTPAGTNNQNTNEYALFDLLNDPEEFLDCDVDELLEVLDRSPKVIRTIRANAQPIIMPIELMPDDVYGGQLDLATYEARAHLIQSNREFQSRLGEALARRFEDKEPSPYVEGQIYDGFPSRGDSNVMERYHQIDWQDRYALCDQIEDERFAELGRRLVYLENPDLVPEVDRARFENWVREQLLSEDDVPWTTIHKALQETEDMLKQKPEDTEQLNDIKDFLLTLADRYR